MDGTYDLPETQIALEALKSQPEHAAPSLKTRVLTKLVYVPLINRLAVKILMKGRISKFQEVLKKHANAVQNQSDPLNCEETFAKIEKEKSLEKRVKAYQKFHSTISSRIDNDVANYKKDIQQEYEECLRIFTDSNTEPEKQKLKKSHESALKEIEKIPDLNERVAAYKTYRNELWSDKRKNQKLSKAIESLKKEIEELFAFEQINDSESPEARNQEHQEYLNYIEDSPDLESKVKAYKQYKNRLCTKTRETRESYITHLKRFLEKNIQRQKFEHARARKNYSLLRSGKRPLSPLEFFIEELDANGLFDAIKKELPNIFPELSHVRDTLIRNLLVKAYQKILAAERDIKSKNGINNHLDYQLKAH